MKLVSPNLLRRRASGCPLSVPYKGKNRQINDTHDASNHAIGDLAPPSIVRPLEAKPAVDDPKNYECATKPHVGVGDDRAFLFAAVDQVVDYAADGLEEHQAEDYEADDGMLVVQLQFTC